MGRSTRTDMGRALHFLERFVSGDPVAKTAAARQQNRVANILEDIQGVGCRIDKPTNREGKGWRIICDGTSDVTLPPDFRTSGLPPTNGHYQYQVLALTDTALTVDWDWVRYKVP